MRVFVSGPMSGYPNWNFATFAAVEQDFTDRGHNVASGRILFAPEIEKGVTRTHKDYVRATLQYLLAFDPDYIVLLEGWEASKGAKAEVAVGITLGIKFVNEYAERIYPEPIEFEFESA